MGAGQWQIDLKRNIGRGLIVEWNELNAVLQGMCLDDQQDQIVWEFEKSGKYSCRSLYRNLTFKGVRPGRIQKFWKVKLPLKIKVFLWLAMHDRIQSGVQLKKRKWKGNMNCILCSVPENTDHILFCCCRAQYVWVCAGEAFGWDRTPDNLKDWHEHWLPVREKEFNLMMEGVVAWNLWKYRNKAAIEKSFDKSPDSILYKIFYDLQIWKVLLKQQEDKLEAKLHDLRSWYEEYKKARVVARQTEFI